MRKKFVAVALAGISALAILTACEVTNLGTVPKLIL